MYWPSKVGSRALTAVDVCPISTTRKPSCLLNWQCLWRSFHRTSRGLHFWEVVPLEVLLEEMAEARSSHASAAGGVAQKLHQLLVPSYFPGPEEGVVRCHAFLPLQAAFLPVS